MSGLGDWLRSYQERNRIREWRRGQVLGLIDEYAENFGQLNFSERVRREQVPQLKALVEQQRQQIAAVIEELTRDE